MNQANSSVQTKFFRKSLLVRKFGCLLFLLTLLLTFPEIPGENTVFTVLQDFFTGVFAPATPMWPNQSAVVQLLRQTPEQADLSTVDPLEDYHELILNCNLRHRQGIPGGAQSTLLPQAQNQLKNSQNSIFFPKYIKNPLCEWVKSSLPARASPVCSLLYA